MSSSLALPLLLSFGLLIFAIQANGFNDIRDPESPDWKKTLKTIRNGIHEIDKYLNFALEMIGGSDGQCRYKCSNGYTPIPRPNYKPLPPNGCGSPVFGFKFDIGIPSMNRCCNQHDTCYDTCGQEKSYCDKQFQVCLESICSNFQKTLGLSKAIQACESAGNLLFDAVMHLGCKPYLDSQRTSCICHYEEKADL